MLAKWVLVRCTRQLVERRSLCLQPKLCRQIPTFWPLLIHIDFSTISISWAFWFWFSYPFLFMAARAPVLLFELRPRWSPFSKANQPLARVRKWASKICFFFIFETTWGPKLPPLWWFYNYLNANVFVIKRGIKTEENSNCKGPRCQSNVEVTKNRQKLLTNSYSLTRCWIQPNSKKTTSNF